jgi:hypothetical protein
VVVIVVAALFGAPLADLGADLAILLYKGAFALHRPNAKGAYFHTFTAAAGAVVVALFSHHGGQAGFAIGGALGTSIYTFLVIHDIGFWLTRRIRS